MKRRHFLGIVATAPVAPALPPVPTTLYPWNASGEYFILSMGCKVQPAFTRKKITGFTLLPGRPRGDY